jgi:hypothetical protein
MHTSVHRMVHTPAYDARLKLKYLSILQKPLVASEIRIHFYLIYVCQSVKEHARPVLHHGLQFQYNNQRLVIFLTHI